MPRAAISLVLFAAATLPVEAAVIRGTVVENRTGYVLSRAIVTLEPIPSFAGQIRSMPTGEAGQFEFPGLAGGAYLLKASRRGFMQMEYGQRRWNSAGTAIVVASDAVLSLHLPLVRYGGITGVVRDANEVGIPDQDVAAYTNTQPPSLVTRTKSDDRGVFRIPGLLPGTYLVRTTGNNDEDRSYLPTFSRQTLRVEEARPVVVYPDEDATDGDVRPIAGRLYDVSGYVVLPGQIALTVTVTLASDMGRTVNNGPAFHFPALPPGRYEIYAEARENPPGNRVFGGYTEFQVERNLTSFTIPSFEVRDGQITLEGAGATVSATAFVRRKDLTGVGAIQTFALSTVNRIPFFPGRWEILAQPSEGYYVSRFTGARNSNARPDGWNEVLIGGFNRLSITLSSASGAIRGLVRSGNAPAAGAPVFLEAWDPVTRKRLAELRETRADMKGNYRFTSLPPGDYRILATFEYTEPDPEALDAAQAQPVHVESSSNPQVDLELYGDR